jgi:hypothetical protein
MKSLSIILLVFFSCKQQPEKNQILLRRVDSLESKLAAAYKPGFGEFMSSIQAHHSKLWFSGESNNWKLADFEVHEIMEVVEDIQKYETERPESQMIKMISDPLDSVNLSIQQKNYNLFKRSFTLLTNTCNNCHRATRFEFNVVKIPKTQPFSNQDFDAIK